jgi:hypothetical protein
MDYIDLIWITYLSNYIDGSSPIYPSGEASPWSAGGGVKTQTFRYKQHSPKILNEAGRKI